MYRKALNDLIEWKDRPSRKPLIIRGARQVGKTWLVRKFAGQFANLIEINFDKNPEKAQLFAGRDISRCLQLLQIDCDAAIMFPARDKSIRKRQSPFPACFSATLAVREFSEVLNTIKFKGVHYIIERGGKPIASMRSIDEKIDPMTLGELKTLLKKLPRLEEELDSFASDLEESSRNQPFMSMEDLWE